MTYSQLRDLHELMLLYVEDAGASRQTVSVDYDVLARTHLISGLSVGDRLVDQALQRARGELKVRVERSVPEAACC